MNVTIAGTGYVGLVTGVCLAEKGHNITCVDTDATKVQKLQNGVCPIYEPGLEDLMKKNKTKITYTTEYSSAYEHADVIFIGVPTPEKKDGSANLSCVFTVTKQIAESVKKECVVVVKSTVPIGTNDTVEALINKNLPENINVHVASNPEFLSQGTAVRDTLYSSRVVLGVQSAFAEKVLREVYAGFDVPVLVTDRKSAEMIKYASNDFLALKISYINEIANLCELVGADIDAVAKGMGYDNRIGDKFLNAGIGYGGSCFPKDTKALHWLASFYDFELKTVKAAIEINENQKLKLIKKARKYYDSFEGLTIAVLGLTFKPETDDLREAPSLVNIPLFLEDGAVVQAWDPVGQANYQNIYPDEIIYCETIELALTNADICFIFTEWECVKQLSPETFLKYMKHPIVLDGRNCFLPESFKESGIVYSSMGRAEVTI